VVTVAVEGVPHEDPAHTGVYSRTAVAYCTVCREGTVEWVDHDCTGYPTSHALPVEEGRRYRVGPDDLDRLLEADDPAAWKAGGHG
jgi:hypothetical protein